MTRRHDKLVSELRKKASKAWECETHEERDAHVRVASFEEKKKVNNEQLKRQLRNCGRRLSKTINWKQA